VSAGRYQSAVRQSVTAIIVTYNRPVLLEECLRAVLGQTVAPDRLLVVDNSEGEDTLKMLRERFPDVPVLRTGENWGCAGGFRDGLGHAYSEDVDWFWLMDDDTIPTPTALENLLEPLERLDGLPAPSIMASKVLWTDGELHLMNWPFPRWDPKAFSIAAAEREVLPLRACTYVSMLIHRRAVAEHGVPIKHWFIWGDDIEYTARVLRHDFGYLAPRSVVYHKTANNYNPMRSSSPRFYYDVRNRIFMLRSVAWRPTEKFWLLLSMVFSTREYLAFNRFDRASVTLVLRGLRDGLLRSPGSRAQRSLDGARRLTPAG
jgi:rhamnopyranosyl-N-acetylglucosaminyl-diphospho-decaprenol beta-1,3/1,4-galactofuranosyltransferase